MPPARYTTGCPTMPLMVWTRSLLTAALLACTAMPAHAWLDSFLPTEVLPLAQGGVEPGDAKGVIPFTTFDHERQQVMDKLPCKWLSMAGGSGLDRYDFLCKGGTWATVSLMFDKSAVDQNGIGRVRLIFREWPETVHPGGGEAYVAQQFLQHVAGHFISAAVAREVQEAFWQKRNRNWRVGRSVVIGYTYENKGQFALRRLEIVGRGAALEGQGAGYVPSRPVTPSEAGLGEAIPGTAPQPNTENRIPKTESVFQPLDYPSQPAQDVSKLPLPRLDGAKPLEDATPEELNTAPEPGTQKVPQGPVDVNQKLVPSAADRVQGRQKAPTNFEAYNKAEELTRDVETKALEDSRKETKIKATEPSKGGSRKTIDDSGAVPTPEESRAVEPKPRVETKPAPPVKPAEPLKAVPTPSMEHVEEATPLERPKGPEQWPQGEGLGSPSQPAATPSTAPQVDGAASNLPSSVTMPGDPRYAPTRNLPQLKFIPKAVPLERVDEVIQFEDEGSGL